MSRVRSVAVVGRDADLWISALSLARALGPAGVTVEVVELPSQVGPHHCYSAGPSLSGLHSLLGLDPNDVLATCHGVPVIGQRFSGWGDAPFIYGYDSRRAAIADVDILQFWSKLRAEGVDLPFELTSPAAVAANRGRVPASVQDPLAFGSVFRGYHLHAFAYVSALRNLALRRQIAVRSASDVAVTRDGDRIASLRLDGGDEMRADLFVDASGADAVLIGGSGGSRWTSWRPWVPVDRLAVSSAPPLSPLAPFADIKAVPDGWVGLFPLANRTAVVGAFTSTIDNADAAAECLRSAVGTDNIPTPVMRRIDPGSRAPWVGNCIAVGASAATFPPMDLMQLHLAHVGVTHLVGWFPADTAEMPEARSYNAIVQGYADNVRDFMIAHYRLNSRVGEGLWDDARASIGPPSLDSRLALFAARGLVPAFDGDTFDDLHWSAMLIGHGLVPGSHDRRADDIPREEVTAKLERMIQLITDQVAEMPTVDDQVRR